MKIYLAQNVFYLGDFVIFVITKYRYIPMNTYTDTLRNYIFKELVNMDRDKLVDVYRYVRVVTAKEEMGKADLGKLLDAAADYAVEAHKKGTSHSTQEVLDRLGKEMGWM